MQENSEKRIIFSVQAARGIAAAMVVFYHAASMFALPKYGNMDVWAGWGNLGKHGVDFFFVLSGFIIYHVHREDIGQAKSLGVYAWKRAVRIYPIYWFFLALFLALNFVGGSFRFTDPGSELATALTLVRFSSAQPPLQVAWTLFHEIAFYALFAVLIVSKRAGIVVFSIWTAAIIVMHQLVATNSPTALTVMYDAINIDFLLGMGVAYIARPVSASAGRALFALGFAGFITTFALWKQDWFGETFASVGYGVAAAIILFSIVGMEIGGSLRTNALFKRMGDATFTIYLSHSIVLSILLKFGSHSVRGSFAASQVYTLLMTAVAIMIGWLLYFVIERPMLRALRQPMQIGRWRMFRPAT